MWDDLFRDIGVSVVGFFILVGLYIVAQKVWDAVVEANENKRKRDWENKQKK